MTPRITRLAAAVALPVTLGIGLSACSGQGGGEAAAPSGSASASQGGSGSTDPFSAAPGTDVDASQLFEQVQKAQQAKKTSHIETVVTAQGQKMTMSGDQDMSDPNKPKAKFSMTVPGRPAMNIILDSENIYMKMPGQAGDKYVKMSLDQVSAGGGSDLRKMLNPTQALEAQKQAVQKVTFKGEEDVSGTKLRHYVMIIDPVKAQKAAGATNVPMPTGTAAATIPYDMWVDSDKLVRKMTLQQNGGDMEMTMSKFGEPVSVTAPPASQVMTPKAPGSAASPAPSATKG